VLAHRGGPGAGAEKLPAADCAFGGQGGDQHARAEQGNPFAPQPSPGRNAAILHGDLVAVGGHDRRGDLGGACPPGLTGAARFGGVIAAGALITLREFIVAVRPQWDTINSGMP
jgi:hypothetical protein